MAESRDVAIAILNWNGRDLLEKFLPSVLHHSGDARVYVIDNASTDDSVAFLTTSHSRVRVITHDQNLGFAAGYNKGLASVKEELVVLLNSDVEVTEGWLQAMLDLMNSDQATAACQPKILDERRREFFEYAGAAGGYIDRYGFPFCRGRIFGTLEKDLGQYDQPGQVFWATGACMMIRRKLFMDAGGFDADFFAHMEEIDLCWRLQRMGFRIMAIPASVVYHVGGATLDKSSSRKTYLNFRNNLAMLYKNAGKRNFHGMLFRKKVLDGIAALKFLLSGQVAASWAVFRAHMYYYSHKTSLRKKRKEVAALSVQEGDSHIYQKSIVGTYYVGGKKKFSDLDFDP